MLNTWLQDHNHGEESEKGAEEQQDCLTPGRGLDFGGQDVPLHPGLRRGNLVHLGPIA